MISKQDGLIYIDREEFGHLQELALHDEVFGTGRVATWQCLHKIIGGRLVVGRPMGFFERLDATGSLDTRWVVL